MNFVNFFRIAEIIEAETDNYLKMDPDPFDERHPIKADPDCALGHILKVLFRKENFMTKVRKSYLMLKTKLGVYLFRIQI